MNTLILRKIHNMIIKLIETNRYNTHSLPKILLSLTIDVSLVDSIYDRLIELEKHQNKQELIRTLNYSVFLESVKIFHNWKYIDYHVAVDSVRNYLNRELHVFELMLISKYCRWFSQQNNKKINDNQIIITKLPTNTQTQTFGKMENNLENNNSESFMSNLWNTFSSFFHF